MIGANYVRYVSAMFNLPEARVTRYFRTHFMGQTNSEIAHGELKYPAPEESHAIPASAIARKVSEFKSAETIAIAHAYGPVDDVVSRFAAAVEATKGRVELNRYAYLSDEKIAALSKFLHDWQQTSARSNGGETI